MIDIHDFIRSHCSLLLGLEVLTIPALTRNSSNSDAILYSTIEQDLIKGRNLEERSSSLLSLSRLGIMKAGGAASTAMVLEDSYDCGIVDEAVGAERVAFGRVGATGEVTESTVASTVPLPNSA